MQQCLTAHTLLAACSFPLDSVLQLKSVACAFTSTCNPQHVSESCLLVLSFSYQGGKPRLMRKDYQGEGRRENKWNEAKTHRADKFLEAGAFPCTTAEVDNHATQQQPTTSTQYFFNRIAAALSSSLGALIWLMQAFQLWPTGHWRSPESFLQQPSATAISSSLHLNTSS